MKKLIPFVFALASVPLAHATPDLSTARIGPTPYDEYMEPVATVLQRLNGGRPSFERVARLMREAYGFRYSFDTPYLAAMPEETARRRAGDCKAKSLWLAQQMNDPSVRYVIGKARRDSKISHAWLMWNYKGKWWVLDPTNLSTPVAASATGANEYLVNYSYTQMGSFRHAPTPRRRAVANHYRTR